MPFFEKAKKRPPSIRNPLLEVGAEVSLKQIDGQLFSCFTLVPVKSGPNFVKCKYLIAVTNYQLVEMYPHPHKVGLAVTAQVHYLHTLAKLKFKKGDPGVLILEFKGNKVSKLIMRDPSSCVDYLKAKMKSMGIKGNLRPKNEKDIANAQNCFAKAKEIEASFASNPSVELIKEMMDLLRRAAEKFSEANDDSYREVTDFISRFLQRPDVVKMLDEWAGVVKHDNTGFELGDDSSFESTPAKPPAEGMVAALPRPPSTRELPRTISSGSDGFGIKPDDLMGDGDFGASNDSESDYTRFMRHIKLPDEDKELSALQQALTYTLNEDDAKYDVIRRPSAVASIESKEKGTAAEQIDAELKVMLQDMTSEFADLLSSFASAGEMDLDEALPDITSQPVH